MGSTYLYGFYRIEIKINMQSYEIQLWNISKGIQTFLDQGTSEKFVFLMPSK